jgi:hypothetical protein
VPAIKRKVLILPQTEDVAELSQADWALRWIADDSSTFAERLVAFAAVEVG